MDLRDEHINGWKSIAAYLGRDRSTVIRWANERALPVHSLPGGRRRTIYAVRSELDSWMRDEGSKLDITPSVDTKFDVAAADVPVREPPVSSDVFAAPSKPALAPSLFPFGVPGRVKRSRHLRATSIAIAALLVLAAALWTLAPHFRPAARSLDPQAETLFLRSKDQLASRSAPHLGAAIKALHNIARRYPNNPDVQAALAEGFLLAREFGSLPDAFALDAARQSALAARKLDPSSAEALRVLGVIAYWGDHDPLAAGRAFRQAIAAKPSDALAHQWYANVLVDNGEVRAAMREFQRARQLNPGAAYLMADYGWGLWVAGQDREGEAILNDLASMQPMMASIHDGLSVMAFARGDLDGYARHLRQRAAARQAPEIMAHSRLIDEVMKSESKQEMYDAMLGRALAQAEAALKSDHSWAALVATVFADRNALLSILRRARSRGEHWGAYGFTRRIANRWKDDHEVISALASLRQASVERGR